MTVGLFAPPVPHWHIHLPEWHPHWPRFHRARVSHWPHASDPSKPPTGWTLYSLHGGLILCNVVWSSLHILMAVPLRKGANAALLAFWREIIGFLALAALALVLDRDKRPPMTRRILGLCALAGALSALIRVTIIAALQHAGPDVTAAITPATPVITLLATLALGIETLKVHNRSGQLQVAGLVTCSLCACSMGLWKGPRLFGTPATGAHAPDNVAEGALCMLFNCVVSSLVQIVNKKALSEYPLLSCTAVVEAFAVCWLGLISAATVPASAVFVDGSVVAAVLFGGLAATAMNNVLLARANKRLGPLVANSYVPVQPVSTAILDYLALGDAFYLSNLLCGVGVIAGLLLVKLGKLRELREIADALRCSVAAASGATPRKSPNGAAAVAAPADADDVADEAAALLQASERHVRRRASLGASSPFVAELSGWLAEHDDVAAPADVEGELERGGWADEREEARLICGAGQAET